MNMNATTFANPSLHRPFFRLNALALTLALACCAAYGQPGGKPLTETRPVKAFDKVEAQGSVDVFLKRGAREEVRLELRNVKAEDVITEVEGGRLVVRLRGNPWNASVKAYVTYRALKEVSAQGACDVVCQDHIDARELSVRVQGSADMTLADVDAERILIRQDGSSDLRVAGRAEAAEIRLDGSSDCEADRLLCLKVDVRVNGASDAAVHATEQIVVEVNGASDVEIHGDPAKERISASGKGGYRYR